MTTVAVRPRSEAELALWRLAFEVAELLEGLDWVVAGAQMVIILEHENGIASGRTTGDIDAVVGGPQAVNATRLAAARLRMAGFERSAEHPHRYERGGDQVDLLTVDHLRAIPRAHQPEDLTPVPGGRRALSTRRHLDLEVAGLGERRLPVPSLAGAIAMKSQAYGARHAVRDLEDVVRMLALVDDVEAVRAQLKPAERRALGRMTGLRDPGGAGWRVLPFPRDAQAAWARLHDE